jgi:transposase
MPRRKEYTPEFKDQAVRFVLEEIGADESRRQACERLAVKLSVRPVTLYNWMKQSAPALARPAASPGSNEELRAQNAALRKENRELARANAILQDAAVFFGAALDRQGSRK